MYRIDEVEIEGLLSSFNLYVYYNEKGSAFDIVDAFQNLLADKYENCSLREFKKFLSNPIIKQYETMGGFVFSGDPCFRRGILNDVVADEIDSKESEDEIGYFHWDSETIEVGESYRYLNIPDYQSKIKIRVLVPKGHEIRMEMVQKDFHLKVTEYKDELGRNSYEFIANGIEELCIIFTYIVYTKIISYSIISIPSFSDKNVEMTYGGNQYSIPLEVLNKYKLR